MTITPIRPGLTNPISMVKTKGNRTGFAISQEIGDDRNIVILNYIESVKIMEDIKEWLHSDDAS